jgi:hypothetical protein
MLLQMKYLPLGWLEAACYHLPERIGIGLLLQQ